MAVAQYKPQAFFVQLSTLAPAVAKLLKTYASRINSQVTTGDVVNTYGVSIVFQVSIEVLTDRCKGCGETQFSPPNCGDCPNHRFVKEWREVSSGESQASTRDAIGRANGRVAKWLRARGVEL